MVIFFNFWDLQNLKKLYILNILKLVFSTLLSLTLIFLFNLGQILVTFYIWKMPVTVYWVNFYSPYEGEWQETKH